MNALEQLISFHFIDKRDTDYKIIYCGVDIFTKVKEITGVIYGNEIKKGNFRFIQDRYLQPNALVTKDPELVKILDELFPRSKKKQ